MQKIILFFLDEGDLLVVDDDMRTDELLDTGVLISTELISKLDEPGGG